MSTRQARTESQRKWRSTTDRRKIEIYLSSELVDSLDAIVAAGDYRGRGEALGALISEHRARKPKRSKASTLHVERQWDRHRCECANANGSRGKRKSAVIVKRKVDGKVMQFAACSRHECASQPHGSVFKSIRPRKGPLR